MLGVFARYPGFPRHDMLYAAEPPPATWGTSGRFIVIQK